MPLFPNLRQRANLPELMDQTDSDPDLLNRTLEQFDWINRVVARSRHLLKQFVIRHMLASPESEYHLIDLGAGACETSVWLLQYCRRRGLRLRVTACDHDPRVVAFARRHYGATPGLNILERDVAALDDLAPFDFVFANHLLHHLSEADITALFAQLERFPQAGVLLNDLRRSRFAYAAFYLASCAFLRGSFARSDGLLSICKGFTVDELLSMAATAAPTPLLRYRITRLFPNRIIVWRPPGSIGPSRGAP